MSQGFTTPLPIPVPVNKGGTGVVTTTANQILYSSSNNVLAGLATANNSVLQTNGSGVPSLVTTVGTVFTPGWNDFNLRRYLCKTRSIRSFKWPV